MVQCRMQEKPNELSGGVTEDIAALRAIVEGTAHSTGDEFFRTLVGHLARAVDAPYAFVAEFVSPENDTQARTIALEPRTGLPTTWSGRLPPRFDLCAPMCSIPWSAAH
jgi:hypothetical protein